MLAMTTLQVGDPIAVFILMERDDFSLWMLTHGSSLYPQR
jgi:hypothetical protein